MGLEDFIEGLRNMLLKQMESYLRRIRLKFLGPIFQIRGFELPHQVLDHSRNPPGGFCAPGHPRGAEAAEL